MYGNVHTPALNEARFGVVALAAVLRPAPGFVPPVAVAFSARGPEGEA